MDDLKRKERTRGGHRSFIKKTLGEVKGLLSNPELERETLFNRKSFLEEQLGVFQTLDNNILKVLEDTDETEEAVIANEIEEAGVLRADIKAAMRLLEEALLQKNSESEANNEGASLNESTVSSKKSVRVRYRNLNCDELSNDCDIQAKHKNNAVNYLTVNEKGKFKWIGSFEELKTLMNELTEKDLKWTSPGGHCKLLELDEAKSDGIRTINHSLLAEKQATILSLNYGFLLTKNR
jgi:hypothetical protein